MLSKNGIQAYEAAYPSSLSARQSARQNLKETVVLESFGDEEEVKIEYTTTKKKTSRKLTKKDK